LASATTKSSRSTLGDLGDRSGASRNKFAEFSPSVTLLNHLATEASSDDWHLTTARTLATAIGLGKGTDKHSPLI